MLNITQDEMLTKVYRDFARLAGEIAVDRCRNRVLLNLVKERFAVSDEELDALFRKEIAENLEDFCHGITGPMLAELQPPAPEAPGCCGQAGAN